MVSVGLSELVITFALTIEMWWLEERTVTKSHSHKVKKNIQQTWSTLVVSHVFEKYNKVHSMNKLVDIRCVSCFWEIQWTPSANQVCLTNQTTMASVHATLWIINALSANQRWVPSLGHRGGYSPCEHCDFTRCYFNSKLQDFTHIERLVIVNTGLFL